MIKLEVKYKNRVRTLTLYHKWDINEDDIIQRQEGLDLENKGKYLELECGYGLYTKIKSITYNAYVTEIGVIKKKDYRTVTRVQYPNTNYSGSLSYEEHPISRRYRRQEYLVAGKFIKTNHKVSLTPRIRMLIKDKLVESMRAKGVTEDYIIDKLLREVDNMRGRGADRLQALSMLARTAGVELEKQATARVEVNQPLFQQFNMGTIQDKRREISTSKELREEIDAVGLNMLPENQAVEFVSMGNEAPKITMDPKKLKNWKEKHESKHK